MPRLRTAVIGVGHLGKHHARVFSKMPNTEFIGVADPDAVAAAAVVKEHGGSHFSDYRELVGKVDAVSIAAPTSMHFEIASAFLGSGAHALIEKPIAVNSADAERLVALADKRHLKIMTGFIERFNPATIAASARLKDPLFIEAHRLGITTFRSGDVSVVHDLLIHDIDLCLHFTRSKPVSVDASGVSVFSGMTDMVSCRIKFASGCVANLTASRASERASRRFRLFTRDAYAVIDTGKKTATMYSRTPMLEQALKKDGAFKVDPKTITDLKGFVFGSLVKTEELPVNASDEPLKLEIDAFFDAIINDKEPPVTPEQIVTGMRLAEDVLASIKKNSA